MPYISFDINVDIVEPHFFDLHNTKLSSLLKNPEGAFIIVA